MRRRYLIGFAVCIAAFATASAVAQTLQANTMDTKKQAEYRVELLGASVGRQWRLEDFAARTGTQGISIRARQEYDFDKSRLLRDVLAEQTRPNAVIIKECAAYFPGDVARYQAMVDGWVADLRRARIQPVLATSAPVTERMPTWLYIKQLIKRYILRRDYVDNGKRLHDIWAYNDFVRDYAAKNKIPLLDIEHVLRVSDRNRALRPEFAGGDGLHLNEAAYRVLDRALQSMLLDIKKK